MGNRISSCTKKKVRKAGEKSAVSTDGANWTLKRVVEVSELGSQKTKELKEQGLPYQVFRIRPKRSVDMLQQDASRAEQAFQRAMAESLASQWHKDKSSNRRDL